MALSNERAIYGSVIQRSLIPQNLASTLNIAMVPINEIDGSYLESGDQSNFRRLISQITGIPIDSMIDERQYKMMIELLTNPGFWEDQRAWHPRYNRNYAANFERFKVKEEFPSQSTVLLATHALSLMVAPVKVPIQRFIPWNTFPDYLKHNMMGKLDLETEAFELGIQCISNALIPDRRVKQFIQTAKNYEIPSGQSPETESDSLLNLFENCKKICLAPMAAGGAASIGLLTQGNYVAALLCAGTGATITLMLIGTVSVADCMVYYLLHKRNAIDKH